MNYSNAEIWFTILTLGAGTFLLRYSFLGAIGSRPMPEWFLRMLRYTPMAMIPGLVAPLVVWPAATGGAPDPARLLAAGVTIAVGLYTRKTLLAMGAGIATLALALWAFG